MNQRQRVGLGWLIMAYSSSISIAIKGGPFWAELFCLIIAFIGLILLIRK